jgi:hypothetical protein
MFTQMSGAICLLVLVAAYWKYPLRSSQLVIRIFFKDTEDLSDKPITGYGDAFN